jgi:N-acetylmuramoyl-L-alanine amidase
VTRRHDKGSRLRFGGQPPRRALCRVSSVLARLGTGCAAAWGVLLTLMWRIRHKKGSDTDRITRTLSIALTAVAAVVTGGTTAMATVPDYPPATWVPASSANYSLADRPHDYPIDMIVIHDTEGSFASAVSHFQNPSVQASAHYVVSKTGLIDEMVLEHDIAWHAGNWDYNTRSIGIEHEGFAWTPGTFTTVEYQTSAHLAASICSRWGVPMDRQHVIGHNEVPDPNHPGLFGGADHHTDPGPYWNWTYYMGQASSYANALPSPPHMVLDAIATPGNASAIVSWSAARTCHVPIASYHISGQPGNIALDVSAIATSATIAGLQNGTTYTFTVTASNADGQDWLTSNAVTPYTVPAEPTRVTATPAYQSAVVTWTAPNDGGRPIVAYRITPYVNGQALAPITFNQTNTTEVVGGLTNGVTYTFVVAAISTGGPGAPSAASNAVTPSVNLRPAAQQQQAASPPARTGATQSSPAPSPLPR